LNAGVPEIGFPPLHTERLVVRPLRSDDVPTVVAYRNDPAVARYQDWDLPFSPADGERMARFLATAPWPLYGDWYQLVIEHDGVVVGEVGVGRTPKGLQADLGYTLARHAQGRGFATEAVGAVVDLLFAEGVHRVHATLDPDNVASARLLERLGFRHEGRTVKASLIRGEWLDDDLYAVTAAERAAWLARDLTPPAAVELIEIDQDNHEAVGGLETHHSQTWFVAPVVWSYADALFPELDPSGEPFVPWLRAVTADGVLVGFVMLAEATVTNPEPFLWRLLVDRWHQGRGIGRRTLALVAERLLAAGHQRMSTSWSPGRGSPAGFYLGLGFEPTGEVIDDEIVAAVDLTRLIIEQ
jgi:RimJ/RimL family protein N-acetyltransferase